MRFDNATRRSGALDLGADHPPHTPVGLISRGGGTDLKRAAAIGKRRSSHSQAAVLEGAGATWKTCSSVISDIAYSSAEAPEAPERLALCRGGILDFGVGLRGGTMLLLLSRFGTLSLPPPAGDAVPDLDLQQFALVLQSL